MVASSPTDTVTKIREAIAFLREAGRTDEADAIESLLPTLPRRLPPKSPPSGQPLVSIAEAARRLGMSRNAVGRRIDLGLLDGTRDQNNGYRFVSLASIERLRDVNRSVRAVSSFPHYLDSEEIASDALLDQMLERARELEEIEEPAHSSGTGRGEE